MVGLDLYWPQWDGTGLEGADFEKGDERRANRKAPAYQRAYCEDAKYTILKT